jgi:hypothetical protein
MGDIIDNMFDHNNHRSFIHLIVLDCEGDIMRKTYFVVRVSKECLEWLKDLKHDHRLKSLDETIEKLLKKKI